MSLDRASQKDERLRRRAGAIFVLIAALCWAACPSATAQQVSAQEHVLDNGMRVLLLPKKGSPNVVAGWIARVGSINERPGITGIAHLFEHMMFKGTRVIGIRDIERNLQVMGELDRVKDEIDREEAALAVRQRLGEIPDPPRPEDLSARHIELRKRFEELSAEEKDLLVKNEFDKIYSGAGAIGMNAGTSNDFTIYFIQVPANKVELWFWMESDRLLNPVFREFYSERDVVREERRLRTESTPTGRFEEQFDALYWQSSPYGWPVIGWPMDIEAVTRSEALSFFDVYYAPNNVTACLVGDFDPTKTLELAKKYFGRLPRGPRDPDPVRTREVPQAAEQRMIAFADTKPQARIRYHTVPDGHVDDFALSLLSDILSDRTGRLYKSLVLEKGIANTVSCYHRTMKYEGTFELSGVAKPESTPEAVEVALIDEVEKLKTEPVPERELQKVKNQFAASLYRRLRSDFSLMFELLIRDTYRGWETINEDSAKIQAVTPEDIQRVAQKYFHAENKSVILYFTKVSEETVEVDPLLADLGEEDRAQVRQFRTMLATAGEEQAAQMLQAMRAQEAAVPPDKKKLVGVLIKLVEDRLGTISAGAANEKSDESSSEAEE